MLVDTSRDSDIRLGGSHHRMRPLKVDLGIFDNSATSSSSFYSWRLHAYRNNLLSFAEFRRWYLDPTRNDYVETTSAVKILQTLGVRYYIPVESTNWAWRFIC